MPPMLLPLERSLVVSMLMEQHELMVMLNHATNAFAIRTLISCQYVNGQHE